MLSTKLRKKTFVSNLYHRTLLSPVPVDEIIELLEEATGFLLDASNEDNEELVRALVIRLRWRGVFLELVAADLTDAGDSRARRWRRMSGTAS